MMSFYRSWLVLINSHFGEMLGEEIDQIYLFLYQELFVLQIVRISRERVLVDFLSKIKGLFLD